MATEQQPIQGGRDTRPVKVSGGTSPRQRRWPQLSAASKASARRVGYAVSIVVNAILLALVQSLPTWGLPFLTPAFGTALWAFNLSLSATIVANALFCAYDERWFRDLTQIALTALSLLATVTLYRIFPFDFGATSANALARLTLGVVNIVLVVALFAQTIAWIVGRAQRALPDDVNDTETSGGQQRSAD